MGGRKIVEKNSLKVLIFPIKISIIILYYNLILAFYIELWNIDQILILTLNNILMQ
jgi:hypothetical protein